jgi:DNA-binding transcriptional ArsR family regulator
MSEAVGLSLSAMSQHLTVLKKADLIDGKKSSQTITYQLKTDDVQQVIALFKQLYCDDET